MSREIAKGLLEIGAVSLANRDNLFTWASGIKSPIYCDNRMTIGYPKLRTLIADSFATLIREKYSHGQVIAGTATAGIPHASILADKLGLPMVYVRAENKDHGKGKQIEGGDVAGKTVILIEDLISTGGSSAKAVAALEGAGAKVIVVLGIFSYGFTNVAEKLHTPFETLTGFEDLIQVAAQFGYISPNDISSLLEWSKNPRVFTD